MQFFYFLRLYKPYVYDAIHNSVTPSHHFRFPQHDFTRFFASYLSNPHNFIFNHSSVPTASSSPLYRLNSISAPAHDIPMNNNINFDVDEEDDERWTNSMPPTYATFIVINENDRQQHQQDEVHKEQRTGNIHSSQTNIHMI